MTTEYTTARGRKYSFGGWPPGGSPTELFDAEKWAECLHATMFAASLRRNPADLEDDGPLHELVHLICGVPICTHNTLERLREDILKLERSVELPPPSVDARMSQHCDRILRLHNALDSGEKIGEAMAARYAESLRILLATFPVAQPVAAPWRGACEHTTANTACRICREKHGDDYDRRAIPVLSPAQRDEHERQIAEHNARHPFQDGRPRRMWINQPSALQAYHRWNATRVLAVPVHEGYATVYFLEGEISSMLCSWDALSEGWPSSTHAENIGA